MGNQEHPTSRQLEWAVFVPVWGDEPQPSDEEQREIQSHLANCTLCNNRVLRARENNPLYKMAEEEEDRGAFWRMVTKTAGQVRRRMWLKMVWQTTVSRVKRAFAKLRTLMQR
ncbi:MAG: hypothetical protein A2754_00540 [Candidatus Magasanikbacteria bacterium RIFCSPHIGHO2_01_FULL_47_8]|uniref:Zinc-finger domain-containing protein n=1 Tax=Candidatus Magasanikbacteria bacterium RIFCSPHIGHO2_01_FULL_47_8 TaxID=1798673 RepID=A0A1F6MCT2_9BACT|nr:MAG: hypothetical protein A2754_00540 [Candidatus Magasanikbacteria bacterium RIFCSPHIGHO2_01_FULL_47_8]